MQKKRERKQAHAHQQDNSIGLFCAVLMRNQMNGTRELVTCTGICERD